MLGAIERKLTAVVGDGLAARAHLSVLEGPVAAPAPDPGKGIAVVSLFEVSTEGSFATGFMGTAPGNPPLFSRRVLPVLFRARLEFFHQPLPGQAAIADARGLLLDDLSLAAHLLADPDLKTGKSFLTDAPDPGFRVLSFDVEKGLTVAALAGANLTASLECSGRAEVWPPGITQPEGVISAIDTIAVTLPARIDGGQGLVKSGTSTNIQLRSFGAKRLVNRATKQTEPAKLAVLVLSDLPPAQRGRILNGDPGVETGVRILTSGGAETVVTYQAPAGDLGSTRVEYVAIHLATADNRKGVFLGSAAVHLAPALP